MGYRLEGRLLEVCNCRVLCPCWVGEDPDFGTCNTVIAWRFDNGAIDGVDVAGLTLAVIGYIPGNILVEASWRAVVYVDAQASSEQEAALLRVFTGQAGGPVADLAKLIGEVVEVRRAPIIFTVREGKGLLKIGDNAYAELEPFQGATGANTTLSDTIFSTVPGAPVFAGKAAKYVSKHPEIGIDTDLTGHNALQSVFVFEAA